MSAKPVRSSEGAPSLSTNLSNEIILLDGEADPELQREGRLRLAARLERAHPALAVQYYEDLAHTSAGDEVSRKALSRLQSLEGRGEFGAYAERLLGQIIENVSDPRVIFPMLGASVAYGATRALVGSRLAASGVWWGRGLIGRILAGGLGFGAEVPSFILLQRQMHSSPRSLGQDLAHGALSLGLLKLSSLALALPLRKLPGQAALQHAAGTLGLFTAIRLEQKFGLRPESEPLAALAESVATYFSLAAGQRAARALMGVGFQRWETSLALRRLPPSGPQNVFLDHGVPLSETMGSVVMAPKGQDAPLLMMSSRGGNRPPLKTPRRSLPPARVKELSIEHQKSFMDARIAPPVRWEALEKYREIHPQLAETRDFLTIQKELLRLVANPGIKSRALKKGGPTESVAYYGYQHRLRGTAAELYVQGLEQSNFVDPMVERGAQIFRKVLESPKIGRAYRPDSRDTESLAYYQENEAGTRHKIFPLYARLLSRLPAGSPEATRGIEMLSRAEWLHQFETINGTAERIVPPAAVGRAYAYLLDAASPAQLASTRETRRHLIQWLPHLEAEARQGNREAMKALVMAARHEKSADVAVTELEQSGGPLGSEVEGLRLSLIHRDQRRRDDRSRLPEPSDSRKLLDKLAYHFREWFWFWH